MCASVCRKETEGKRSSEVKRLHISITIKGLYDPSRVVSVHNPVIYSCASVSLRPVILITAKLRRFNLNTRLKSQYRKSHNTHTYILTPMQYTACPCNNTISNGPGRNGNKHTFFKASNCILADEDYILEAFTRI